MRIYLIAAAAAAAVIAYAVAAGSRLDGFITYVRDADTVVVGEQPVRLQGINAPERDQTLWHEGRSLMLRLAGGQHVACELDGSRTRDRVVGVCRLDDGRDVGAEVIKAGLATDCPAYSGGRYASYETPEARRWIQIPGYCE